MRREFERRPRIEGAGVVAIVAIIIVAGALIFSVGQVSVGYVAVIIDPLSGSVSIQGDGQNAKYFLKPPYANVVRVYTATDSVHMWSEAGMQGDFPAVPSLTKDGLKVDVDITVRWRLSPSEVVSLFRQFPGLDWKERAIIPIIREAIRDLIAQYTAIETIEQREKISVKMEGILSEAFNKESTLSNAVILEAVDLRQISLPDGFIRAIESKLASEQLSIAAEFNKTRILVIANATAMSQIIQANGAAISKLILANATRDALNIIAGNQPDLNIGQLTNLYLYLETLKAISETGKSTFIIIPSETGNFIIQLPPSS
ncbi:prohibitin family protein [Candidatus Bathyarchaeota archaeon]|nr:prohibitin family protein [Candidatus Bathyarchaeota archaeon]MBS7630715.1 prohibitin family protein [Candidatus Bathyarchaeota archaeon]